MAALLVWQYGGGEDAELRGEQRAFPEDAVIDDVLGDGKIKSIAGGDLLCQFPEGSETVERLRTKGHVRALANRVRREPRVAATAARRPGAQQTNLFAMMGKEKPPDKPQLPKSTSKGLGKRAAPSGHCSAHPG